MKPLIVVAGRPNVGKSTLFNRLVGRRRAVTHETAGVTRDPIEETVVLDGTECRLVDTGGFAMYGDDLQQMVVEKGWQYLKEAAIIVLLLDIRELTPEDQDFIHELRPFSEKIIVAANKADNADLELETTALYDTGFSEIVPVSALHNRNIDYLIGLIGKRVRGLMETMPLSDGYGEAAALDLRSIGITLIGKPNTGKSTLLNTLLSADKAIVSDVPGTTRDVITGTFSHKDHTINVMDTAGIRRKKKVSEDLEYYSVTRAIDSLKNADIALLMIDAKSGLTEQDKKIAAHAANKGRGIILVVNKWDLMEKIENAENAFADRIRFLFPILAFAPIVFISALEKRNIGDLKNAILEVWRQLNRTIQTSTLNKHLKQWKERNPLPRKKSFQWKIKYITQTGSNPVSFVLFVNRKKGFPAFYTRYVMNNLRSEFSLSKIPIRLDLQESGRTGP